MLASSSDLRACHCLTPICAKAHPFLNCVLLLFLNVLLLAVQGTATKLSACGLGPVLCDLGRVSPALAPSVGQVTGVCRL